MARTFTKQPAEVLDYFIDMREYFAELDTDFIALPADVDVTVEGSDSALVAGSTVLVNDGYDGFKQWFNGGTNGVKYKITFLITTDVGRVEEVEMYIKVKDT